MRKMVEVFSCLFIKGSIFLGIMMVLSSCCSKNLTAVHADEGTSYYICNACSCPTDGIYIEIIDDKEIAHDDRSSESN